MSNRPVTKRSRGWGGALLGLLLLSTAACQELHVENLVEPDRNRATANPGDVEAFIGGAFHPPFWEALHRISQSRQLWPQASGTFTATFSPAGDTELRWEDLQEPRIAHNNAATISLGNGPHGPRNTWAEVTRANTIAYDGLQILDGGLLICDPVSTQRPCPAGSVDRTPRARAFAKLIQGWTWGYLGLVFDQTHVVGEEVDIPPDPAALLELTLNTIVPYDSVIRASIGAIEEAIQIAQQNPDVVHYPSDAEAPTWFRSQDPITNTQFIQMANTLAARILILSARTPADRAALDWNRILQFTNNGLTQATGDYQRALASGSSRDSPFFLDIQRNGTTDIWNTRWNYRTIGMADQSGAYQAWIAAPLSQRDRFDIVTPDRRITGDTPTSDGTYTVYRADNNGFAIERGTYRFSAYQWMRHALRLGLTGTATGYQSDATPLISADENTLLRAEALLRTGNAQGAADLVNVTRTREHMGQSLPPVTAAGVPQVGGVCVPRRDNGTCGTLYDALRYERLIELSHLDLFWAYMDGRGFGMLPDGSLLDWPIPGNALDIYGLANYTYGGVGNPNTATYAPVSNP